MGLKPEQITNFKARHGLDSEKPLSPEAQDHLLRNEIKEDQRAVKGHELSTSQLRETIEQRIQLKLIKGIADQAEAAEMTSKLATEYLISASK